ncbi:DUF2304 domain-containing protein [Turicibacter bilis]|uniref:DUF2304 domain-containing protein n=1 Tax=Turicibacter bilis TaxID=2735723 RepID=A0ABY5JMP9_9FIRM|nr:DUF2304 domain-containing protein [Turicibacter bilis]MBS3200960.1 DUF2304 domain-containing protein [Turicibacter bilis]UUF07136.1 DUF2304 domain-containing protein [Turicibacter bilis]
MGGRIISLELQFALIIGALATYTYVIYKIRKSNVRIDDMIIWVIGSVLLLLLSIFPIIPAKIASILGFISAANFIFCAIIFFLLLMVFSLSVKLSQQHEKLKDITHNLAMLEKRLEERRKNDAHK